MRAELTPAVLRAVEQAGASLRLLLLALVDEEEGRAAQWLAGRGASLPAFRTALQSVPLESSFAIESLLPSAAALAVKLQGGPTVGTDHLLMAAVCEEPGLRALLQPCGMDLSGIEFGSSEGAELELDEPLDLSPATEQLDTARILDACANRAREALRVVEDYVRFVLDDAFLCRELKVLRHDLTEALSSADPLPLLEARETIGDVGTMIGTDAEGRRGSPLHVVQVNLKRLQEALRSLEEFGKVVRPELGAALEQIRYRSYTMERTILLGVNARERLANARLYLLLTGSACATSLDFVIAEAAAGGVDVVQLREKNLPDRDLLERARKVRLWTRQAGVLFIVNDRPDIARLADADGVHLGQDDMPVHAARRIVGPNALIGVSTHTMEQARQAIRDGASYLGVGPVYSSRTKSFEGFPGLDFVREVAAETTLPWFALGGMTVDNVAAVIDAGAQRVAVSSAICAVDEPRPVAAMMKSHLASRER